MISQRLFAGKIVGERLGPEACLIDKFQTGSLSGWRPEWPPKLLRNEVLTLTTHGVVD